MHALEDEPEAKNRWRRFVTGGAIAGGLAVGLIFGARHVEPARRLMPEILQIAVVDEEPPPPPKNLPPPPPPPPPPPKPKKEPPPEPDQKPVEQPPEEQLAQAPSDMEPTAGLDGSSFGAGSGGVSFRTGNTQMGDPNRPARRIEIAKISSKPPKLFPARALNPVLPDYPERARKLNIQGFVLLEAEIDDHGKLVGIRVRQGLERGVDEIALASVKRWRFSPATLAGRAVPSTRLIRIRFELD
jgi:protein TonB